MLSPNNVRLFHNTKGKDKNPRAPDWSGKGAVAVGMDVCPVEVLGWNDHGPQAGDYIFLVIKVDDERQPPDPRDVDESGAS